jgi:DNA-binding transcriptional regulator YhcF (GntR family)
MSRWLCAVSCRRIYNIIHKKILHNGSCQISQLDLAIESDYSLPTTRKALQILVTHNIIKATPGKPMTYQIINPLENHNEALT